MTLNLGYEKWISGIEIWKGGDGKYATEIIIQRKVGLVWIDCPGDPNSTTEGNVL